jgi:hypothetical protein
MNSAYQAWYAEFLLEVILKILLRKTGVRLNFKIALISLHIDPGFNPINQKNSLNPGHRNGS